MNTILFALSFVLAPLKGSAYLNEFYIGILFVGFLIASEIAKKVHWLPAIHFLYLTLLTLLYWVFPMQFNQGLDVTVILGLQVLLAQSFVYIVLLCLPFIILSEEAIVKFYLGICYLGWIDSYVMLYKIVKGKLPYFLMDNPAMDTAFICCCLPIFINIVEKFPSSKVLKFYHYLLWVFIPIFVCFATKTSSGILGVGVAISSFYWSKNGLKKLHALYAFVIGGVVAGIGYMLQKDVILDSSGRYTVWRDSFKFWLNQGDSLNPPHIPPFFGSGIGSFFMYGPTIQLQDTLKAGGNSREIFIWMHNDWAQILFETGYIGLLLTLLVFGVALFKSRKIPVIFSSLLTLGCLGFIQMPLRHFSFASLCLFLITRAFKSPEKVNLETVVYKKYIKDY